MTTAALRQMTEADLPAVLSIERATFPFDAWSEGMLRGSWPTSRAPGTT